MEVFGIALSIPAAFVASMLYCLLLGLVMVKFAQSSRWLRFASFFVLALFAAELVLLVAIGAVRTRGLVGPHYFAAHLVLFLLCTPALANVLVLRPRGGLVSMWYVAGPFCTCFAFFLVLLQYAVSESLYGIDGENGPYNDFPAQDASPPPANHTR